MSVTPLGNDSQRLVWQKRMALPAEEDYTIPPEIADVWLDFWFQDCVQVDTAASLFNRRNKIMEQPVQRLHPRSKCSCVAMLGSSKEGRCENVYKIRLSTLSVQVCHILIVAFVRSDTPAFKLNSVRVAMRSDPSEGQDVVMCQSHLESVVGPRVVLGQLTRQQGHWNFRTLKSQLHHEEIDRCLLRHDLYECLEQKQADPPQARRVVITVCEGRNLAMKDINVMTRRPHSSDPYFIIQYKDVVPYQSEYISKTVNPVWGEHQFIVKEIIKAEIQEVKITLYDYDFMQRDDFMGVIYISAEKLFDMAIGDHDDWLPVEKSRDPKLENEEVSGEIRVRFAISDVPV